ncbi:hypothetical protein HFP69_17925 [Streptomyces sp. ARC12]|uniref:hypothetical protein n=1 Tax=Streptomyces TaxID=1883 RepID=UPI00342C1791
MLIDSRLRSVHAGRTGADPKRECLARQLITSRGPEGVDAVLDGACTLIFLYMKWLREAHEAHDKDVIEYVVPSLVTTLKRMPRSIPPEAVPMMAGLAIAAAAGLSPTLWRKQYGDWTRGRGEGRALRGPGGRSLRNPWFCGSSRLRVRRALPAWRAHPGLALMAG